jgi:hypothetical protein
MNEIYQYNKDEIKNSLTIDNIYDLLEEWHADPQMNGDVIIARTIDHNYIDDLSATNKLYYYDNSKLFVSYTSGNDAFDIFELVLKVKNREENREWELPQAVHFIAQRLGISPQDYNEIKENNIYLDLKLLANYDRIKEINPKTQEVILKEYPNIIKNLPQPKIVPWLEEGISQETIERHHIRYNPVTNSIIIPHYDINNRLVGIRERNLDQDRIEQYGKYHPAYIGGKMYNHQLSYNLYNINYAKDNIKKIRKAVVFESEKSCLLYSTYFGADYDISVAPCGSNLLNYHVWLLLQLNVDEIIIGLDKDFEKTGDETFKRIVKNLKKIFYKYSAYIKISILFDKENLLGHKESPVDKDKQTFIELYDRRFNLYG